MKAETKHTPGPWTIHNNLGRKGELGIMADTAPCIIAIMGNQKAWPVEAIANANLIAAAPDMLQALEEIATRAPLSDYASTSALHLRLVGTQSIARAAIAKAKGNQ